jgi:tetratricopeptide (TPR) repeat protein
VLVGRDKELAELASNLETAVGGRGRILFVSGEPGIGKTTLAEGFRRVAVERGARVLHGSAEQEIARPFLVFSKALEGLGSGRLFEEQEYATFAQVFAINRAGLLAANASSEKDSLDADIFAGMLSAVQDFVRDSFGRSGDKKSGLGKLEYGDMKILIEHGRYLFLAAVVKGAEHQEMGSLLRTSLRDIEEHHGQLLETWSGNTAELGPVQEKLLTLTKAKFLVQKNLEGVKLETERLKIADKVLDKLIGISNTAPLVLLLEDLHWADEQSLFVLEYVARNIVENRILVLGTLRPEENKLASATVRKIREESNAGEIRLGTLDKVGLKGLADLLFSPNEFSQGFYEALMRDSRGIPFVASEALKQMLAEGAIALADNKYTLTGKDFSLPNTVEALVQRRLDWLEPDAVSMAEYASCLGKDFDVNAALSTQTLSDPEASLSRLVKAGIVYRKNGSVEFSHSFFQKVVYDNISQRWKTAYHKSIGEYYERTYAEKLSDAAYELARHFSKSGNQAKTLEYCMMAGKKAELAYAADLAAGFYSNALTALAGARPADKNRLGVNLFTSLGDAFSLASNFEHAMSAYGSAIEMTDDTPAKANLHRKLAMVLEKKGKYVESLSECNQGLALVDSDKSIETVKLLNATGGVYTRLGDHDKALGVLNRSLAISEKEGYELEGAQARHIIANVHWYRGEYAKTLDNLIQTIEVRKKAGDLAALSKTYNNLGVACNDLGKVDEALAYHAKSLELKEKIGDKQGVMISLGNLGVIYYHSGQLDKALSNFKKARETAERIGDISGQATALTNLANILREQGDIDGSLATLEKSMNLAASIGKKPLLVRLNSGMVESLLIKGDVKQAIERALTALSISREMNSKADEVTSRWVLGFAYRIAERLDESEAELSKSIEISREIGDHSGEARARFDLGRTLKAKGDKNRALAEMRAAKEKFEKLRMELWTERCNKELDELI